MQTQLAPTIAQQPLPSRTLDNSVREGAELIIHVQNLQEGLQHVLPLLSDNHLDVLAFSTVHERHGVSLLVVTEEPERARTVLEKADFTAKIEHGVWVALTPYRPGMVAHYGFRLVKHGIHILRSHVYSLNNRGCLAVFNTSDNAAAVRLLRKAGEQEAA